MNTQGIISILALTASLIGFNTVQAHDRETRHASHNKQQYSNDSHQRDTQNRNNHQRSTRNRDNHQRDNDRPNLRKKQRHITTTALYLKHKYQHKHGVSHRHPSSFAHSHKSWRKHHTYWRSLKRNNRYSRYDKHRDSRRYRNRDYHQERRYSYY